MARRQSLKKVLKAANMDYDICYADGSADNCFGTESV